MKSEKELWFMAVSGYTVPQCAREWNIGVTTLKDYLRGKKNDRYTIPERLTRYRELTERVRDGKVSETLANPEEIIDGKVVSDE